MPGHEKTDKETLIPENKHIMEDEYEEKMLNRNNEEIEGENVEIDNV